MRQKSIGNEFFNPIHSNHCKPKWGYTSSLRSWARKGVRQSSEQWVNLRFLEFLSHIPGRRPSAELKPKTGDLLTFSLSPSREREKRGANPRPQAIFCHTTPLALLAVRGWGDRFALTLPKFTMR